MNKQHLKLFQRLQTCCNHLNNNYQYLSYKNKEDYSNQIQQKENNKTKEELLKEKETFFDQLLECHLQMKTVSNTRNIFVDLLEEYLQFVKELTDDIDSATEFYSQQINTVMNEMKQLEYEIYQEKCSQQPVLKLHYEDKFELSLEENYQLSHFTKSSNNNIDKSNNKVGKDKQSKKQQYCEKTKGMTTIDEMKQLEKWTGLSCNEILFDSQIDNWGIMTSTFDQQIFGKEKILILIEDYEENVFGCYINSTIDTYTFKENDKWKRGKVKDSNAFVYSLRSNGRLEKPMKFEIDSMWKNSAFTLFKSDHNTLFDVGGFDISIKKEESKDNCYCQQSNYNYQDQTDVLIGKTGFENTFEPKHFIVIQMGQSIQHQKEQIIEQKENDLIERQMRRQIEEWTDKHSNEILFDSNKDNWNLKTSVFDKQIFGKQSLVCIIEDENENIFGGYIDSPISSYSYREEGEWKGGSNKNPNGFLFVLKSNRKLMKKKLTSLGKTFTLYQSNWGRLFDFGKDDIEIMKKEMKDDCMCCSMLFDTDKSMKIVVKHIQVIQLV